MARRHSRSQPHLRRRAATAAQLGLSTRGTRGGYRANAGRPCTRLPSLGSGGGRNHLRRPSLSPHTPVHCTLRICDGLPSLRRHHLWDMLRVRFRAGCDRFGFRLVNFSVQTNHVHLVCEGNDCRALTRGMQGLAIRLARCVNKKLGRSGKVFAHRYHARQLPTPTETRNALHYVLGNFARHAGFPPGTAIDVFSTAARLVQSRLARRVVNLDDEPPPTTAPRSYLLRAERARLARRGLP